MKKRRDKSGLSPRRPLLLGFFICLFLILLGFTYSQEKNSDLTELTQEESSRLINQLIVDSDMNGNLLVSKRKQEIIRQAYGYSDEDEEIASLNTTIYPLASIQKTFTALLIAQLVEEGKLTYDSKLGDFRPDIPKSNNVTIRELLEHTSSYVMPETASEDVLEDEEEQVEYAKETTDYTGYHSFFYTNVNYTYLAAVIKKIEGSSYKESLQKRIIAPLGLENTYFWDDLPTTANVAEEIKGSNSLQKVYSLELMSTLLGAGNLYMSVDDLIKYQEAINDNKLVKQTTFDDLVKPKTNANYAGGYFLTGDNCLAVTGNISSNQLGSGGYVSLLYTNREQDIIIGWLGNSLPSNSLINIGKSIYQDIGKS
ncbi:serine hydrolase [Streptococcaceae bacterium ESL0687]|nr:serine hydrolase [Streptococcaceae bacterium ESL0687]